MKKLFLMLAATTTIATGCGRGDDPNANTVPTPVCGIEQCHGLDVSCGAQIPEVCTELYQLGDFCHQFVNCRVVEGSCAMVETETFEQCKSCAAACEKLNGPAAFDCENDCRLKFE